MELMATPEASTSKVGKKAKKTKTYRFELSLEVAKNGYPDFNWLDLVANEEEARAEAKKREALDPYASDDDDQLKALAKKFEEKYGGAGEKIRKKKKARKLDDYADLGFGYDSNDPFIDNSDVHDEIVPESLTTAHGGFYINCGPLEFKARESADEDSDVEAVLAEGEKAVAKKQRSKKEMAAEPSSDKKPPRARKEGSKPLGRPKKRNPDGSLMHPPRQKKRVATEATSNDEKQLLEQQREEMLQKQLLQQVQEMQRRQEELQKQKAESEKKRKAAEQEQKRLQETQQQAELEQQLIRMFEQQRKLEQEQMQQKRLQQLEQQRKNEQEKKRLQQLEQQRRLQQKLELQKKAAEKEQQQKRLQQQQLELKRKAEQEQLQQKRLQQLELQKKAEQEQLQQKRLQQLELQKKAEQEQLQQKRLQQLQLELQKKAEQEQKKHQQLEQQRREQLVLLEQQKAEQEKKQQQLKFIEQQQRQQQQKVELEKKRKALQQQQEKQRQFEAQQKMMLQQQQEQNRQVELQKKIAEQQMQLKQQEHQRLLKQQQLEKQRLAKQQHMESPRFTSPQHDQQQRTLIVQAHGASNKSGLTIESLKMSPQSQAQQLLQQLQQPYPSTSLTNLKQPSTGTMITPENASQMLASMQPQPPSSLGHYLKTPNSTPPKQQHLTPNSNYFEQTQSIRLPTVPVPSTSVFSSGLVSPVISSHAAPTYVNTPTAQLPTFSMSFTQPNQASPTTTAYVIPKDSYQHFFNNSAPK